MKNLIIIGHPNVESFCYDGIFKTIYSELSKNNEEIEVIDLYRDDFIRPRKALTEKYQRTSYYGLKEFILFLLFGGLD